MSGAPVEGTQPAAKLSKISAADEAVPTGTVQQK
jgi:hypothetical protein